MFINTREHWLGFHLLNVTPWCRWRNRLVCVSWNEFCWWESLVLTVVLLFLDYIKGDCGTSFPAFIVQLRESWAVLHCVYDAMINPKVTATFLKSEWRADISCCFFCWLQRRSSWGKHCVCYSVVWEVKEQVESCSLSRKKTIKTQR